MSRNVLARMGCWLVCAGYLFAGGAARADLEVELVSDQFSVPIYLTAPANDDRLFVLERGGAIRVVDGGALQGPAYLTIGDVNTTGEGGLLGLAFHPDFASNGRFYVNYTVDRNPGGGVDLRTVIEEYVVTDPAANVATIDSQKTIITMDQPYNNHNAGWIGFSPTDAADHLYIPTGDGGAGNDPGNRAQNLGSLFGKVLRLDVSGDDHPADPTRNYAVPASNPFVDGDPGTLDEIWAYGLRNPYRDSFDRDTGDFYLGDVGQNDREEIDRQPFDSPGGENYGWRIREGLADNPRVGGSLTPAERTDPIIDYDHDDLPANRGSVTGGYVYRGALLTEAYDGLYFYGDYVNGKFWTLDPEAGDVDASITEITTDLFPGGFGSQRLLSFGEDASGELYVLNAYGSVYRIMPEVLLGDCDLNGVVDAADIDDFVAVLQGAIDDPTAALAADTDGNGTIDTADIDDFVAILQGGAASVPEPSALALLGVGGLALLRRRGAGPTPLGRG